MQPYVNPNYFSQYQQPQMNPYQQRMDFLQTYQQSLQQPLQMQQSQQINTGMNGRIVQSVDMITPNEIPMDCSPAIFPKQDLSEIYVKHWDNNGKIRTIVFKPLLEADPNNSSTEQEKANLWALQSVTEVFNERFDKLENQINEILAKSTPKTATSKAKKESVENE